MEIACHDDVTPGLRVHADGSVSVWVRVATPGRMAYPEHGRVVWVPPETLKDAVAADTLRGKAIFIEHLANVHPTAEELRDAVGTVEATEIVGHELYARVRLTSPRGLRYGDARGWRLTVSPSYTAEWAPGQAGCDITQIRRRYGHLALTDSPRGGPRVQSILEAHDSLPGVRMEALKALLAELGVPAEKLTDEMLGKITAAMKPAEDKAAADMSAEPEKAAAMDALRAQVKSALEQRDAAIRERDAERLASCSDSVLAAARGQGLTLGDKPDVLKLAEQVLSARGVRRAGMDAALFLRDSARFGVQATHDSRARIVEPVTTTGAARAPQGADY